MVVLSELGRDAVRGEFTPFVDLRDPATNVAVPRRFDEHHVRQAIERLEREHVRQSAFTLMRIADPGSARALLAEGGTSGRSLARASSSTVRHSAGDGPAVST